MSNTAIRLKVLLEIALTTAGLELSSILILAALETWVSLARGQVAVPLEAVKRPKLVQLVPLFKE